MHEKKYSQRGAPFHCGKRKGKAQNVLELQIVELFGRIIGLIVIQHVPLGVLCNLLSLFCALFLLLHEI